VSCHREDAGGNIGPNLTDEYWLHGGSMNDIIKVVADGVPENGMISWKPLLKKNQIIAVSNYIKSLKGTNPENPKDPQGDVWEDTAEDNKPAGNTDVSMK
jgi:cytochrome c oxidase cbb3-type subunit 3